MTRSSTPSSSLDDEVCAYNEAVQVGKQAYRRSIATELATECPYEDDGAGDGLNGVRMSGWFDGFSWEKEKHGEGDWEVLGTPRDVKEIANSDGTFTYIVSAGAPPSQ